MDKIATPKDLVSELQRVIAYAGSEKPSRAKLSSALSSLAGKVSSQEKTAASIKLPMFVGASDYHEFDQIKSILKKLGVKVEVLEVDGEEYNLPYKVPGPYVGLLCSSSKEGKTYLKSLEKK
jgi:hypothetical protein